MKSYIIILIYYVNGFLYIGYVFILIMVDILKCNWQVLGYEMMLFIGVDEYGQKNQEVVEDFGMLVIDYFDMCCVEFCDVFEKFGVEFDYFVCISCEGYKKVVVDME